MILIPKTIHLQKCAARRAPSLVQPPSGCRFHPRCPVAEEECPINEPTLYQVGSAQSRCLLHAPDRAALRAAARDAAPRAEVTS